MTAARRVGPAGWTSGGVVLAGLLVLGFAPVLGLERLPLIAAALPARNAWTAGTAVLGIAAALAGIRRRGVLPVAAALLVGAAASGAVVLQHGTTNGPPTGSGLRILSWNINGALVPPDAIARLAVRERADLVVLPEIAPDVDGARYVPAFERAGLPVQALPAIGGGDAETVVLVRKGLGPYRLAAARSPEPERSAVLEPGDAALPRLVAIHAIIPGPRGTGDWDADLRWVSVQCADPDTVAVGDFNTSIDGFGGPGLGGCADAAAGLGAASVGSWPTALPTWLAMPIDHVLVGADWRARSFTVLTDEDGSGARHRPVLAVVARR